MALSILRVISNTRIWSVFAIIIIVGIISLSLTSDRLPTNYLSNSSATRQGSLDHINNATLGFQKIFMINLPARTDHKDAAALAASLTGLEIDFVEAKTNVSAKAIPAGKASTYLTQQAFGNWRSHMDVARLMVENDIQSALVLEDDVDWDIRIKSQMQQFAQAAHLLLQPVKDLPGTYLDPTFPKPEGKKTQYTDFNVGEYATQEPTSSPYGDLENWDMFWLGHCGCRFPRASDENAPIGRAVILNDTTVPEQQHLDMQFGTKELLQEYGSHTRVVSRARVNTCTLGYALSLPGARRFLYELSIRKLDGTTDMDVRAFCDGSGDRPIHTCLTVQPQLFQHHRPVGLKSSGSDISDPQDGYRTEAFTRNVRWSTRLNIAQLMNGSTDYIDLFMDGQPAQKHEF